MLSLWVRVNLSNGNEGVLYIPQSSRNETSRSDCLMSYPGYLLVGSLTLWRDLMCFLQPQLTELILHGLAEKFVLWYYICCWWLFWLIGSKHYNTDRKSVWTTKRTILKNKLYLVTVHGSILVSLWTFQPTHLLYKKWYRKRKQQ